MHMKGKIACVYLCKMNEWVVFIYIYIYIYICSTQERNRQVIYKHMNISRERYRFFVYRYAHIRKGGWYLYTYRRVSRRNGRSGYQHINMCTWRIYLQCWVCCFSLLIMTPHQPVGSCSYVINVAAPYSTHKCFAFVPASHSESVIHSTPLTLLLQSK